MENLDEITRYPSDGLNSISLVPLQSVRIITNGESYRSGGGCAKELSSSDSKTTFTSFMNESENLLSPYRLKRGHNKDDSGYGDGSASVLSQKIENTRRDAVMTLSEKREKKAELIRIESQKPQEKTISITKIAKYRISMSCQRSKEAIKGVFYSLELWYNSLKVIEGNFGSGVTSYFKFLRWLFVLNFFTLIISFSFLTFPQILSRVFVNVQEIPEVAINGGTYLEKKFSDPRGLNGTDPPPLTASALLQRGNPYGQNEKFCVTDLFTGEGFFTATSLYYGFYQNSSIELCEGYSYDVPNAYFFSMVVCYLVILITVSMSMARSYRKTFIETRKSSKSSLALKVFCGWDYSIATPEGASLNKMSVYNDIKEALNEEEFRSRASSCLFYCKTLIVRFSLNIIFIFLMAGIAFLMWNLLGMHSAYLNLNSTENGSNTMTMAIITSLIMNVLPMGFSCLIRYENYRNPRTALYVTLMRTFVLNVVVISTLAAFWLTHSQECWETSLGQEVYRLLVVDFIISVLVMGLVETLWSVIQRKVWKKNHRREFDIAWNTLNLIYNQTLFLVGFYFSPLLSAVIVFKLFITFHVKKYVALHNCQAPRKSWRAAQTHTVFLILTFMTLLGVFLGFGFIIFKVHPSECGPFSGYSYMYLAILERILNLHEGHMFWKAIMYLTKPGVVGGILIAMSIATYILQAQAQAHAFEADILNNMLVNETKDKVFLFKYLKKIDEINKRKQSPAISSRSSFHSHTPLSERRQMMKILSEKKSSPLLHLNRGLKDLASSRKFSSTTLLGPRNNWGVSSFNSKPFEKSHRRSTSCGAKAVTYGLEFSQL